MITKNFNIYVDFNNKVTYAPTRFTAGDSGSCTMTFKTVQDITGLRVFVNFLMSDATTYILEATVSDANTATLTLPSGVLSVVGEVSCQVALYDTDARLTQPLSFGYTVVTDLADSAIAASDQYPIITQLILDCEAIEDAEELRVTAENSRDEAEGLRDTAEGLRKQAETARENAEDLRDTAEGQRELAEGARQDAYVLAEAARNTAYGVAEGVRDGLYTTAEGSRNTAYGEAEDARDGLYATAEGARNSDYALAEGLRDDDYADAEAARDVLYESRENLRDEIVIANANKISALQGFVGYVDYGNDVYGVEIDMENKTFTRIAGAAGLSAGADFDDTAAFGGRRRCNLADDGTVNAYFGDVGYTEDGSNGQVMVEQPRFYYRVMPLKLVPNNDVEISTVKVTGAATADGSITITLNGVAHAIAVTNGDTTAQVAGKIRGASFTGWSVAGSSDNAEFTADTVGTKSNTTFSGGSTGVTATVTHTQKGYIGKGFKNYKFRLYVSDNQHEGMKLHPAFIKNGVEKSKIYLSAYEGSLFDVSASAYILNDAQTVDFTATTGDKLSSIANAKPVSGLTQDLTRRKCGITAENRGTGWSQQYAATAACTQLLFTVEYAALNSQTAIGRGVVDKASGTGNESEITGATTLLGNASGMAAGTNGLTSITYRGEENFWGNIFKFTDGMNIYCDISNSVHDLYIADNSFAESTQASPYANAGITLATRSGYVTAMAYNETYDWLFVPAETLGDSALPVGDYFYQAAATPGYKIAQLGGTWSNGSINGAFYWNVSNAPSNRTRIFGGRLVYV